MAKKLELDLDINTSKTAIETLLEEGYTPTEILDWFAEIVDASADSRAKKKAETDMVDTIATLLADYIEKYYPERYAGWEYEEVFAKMQHYVRYLARECGPGFGGF